jgi:hypothetical protein
MRSPRPLPVSFGWNSLAQTWQLFSRARGKILGFAALSIAISFGVSMIPGVGMIAAGFFYPMILGGGIRLLAALDRGENPKVDDFFAPITDGALFKRYLPLACVCAAFMLAAVVVSAVMAAMLGLNQGSSVREMPAIMIPGLTRGVPLPNVVALLGGMVSVLMSMVMAVLCLYAPALIELEGATAKEGMEQSLSLTTKNWLPFLILGFVFLLPGAVLLIPASLLVLVSIPLGILFLMVGTLAAAVITGCLSFCAPYIIYRATFRSDAVPAPASENPQNPAEI